MGTSRSQVSRLLDKLADDLKGYLFRTIQRGTGRLSETPLHQADAHAMIRRRAAAAEIGTTVGNHTFRATGITAYLKNDRTNRYAAAISVRPAGDGLQHSPRGAAS